MKENQKKAARKRTLLRRRAGAAFVGALIPLTAYSLGLPDYLNTATVTASSSQFEQNTTNNDGQIQVTPNAELTIVKVVTNDNGGTAGIADFSVSTNAGALTFDAGTTVGSDTTYTATTLFVPPGTYSLVEADVVGYAEGTWSCDVGTVNNSSFNAGEVALAFGEQATCTITNNDLGIDLTITKAVDDDTPNIGDVVTFTMVVSNAGPDVATDVTVTDIVPAGFTYAGTITGGDANDDSSPTGTGLSWTINSIASGASSGSLTFTATVLAP